MIRDNEFLQVWNQQEGQGHTVSPKHIWWYSGTLIFIGESGAIVDEEGVEQLPKFIKSKSDALAYIRGLDNTYSQGIEDGKSRLQQSFLRLVGATPIDSHHRLQERLVNKEVI